MKKLTILFLTLLLLTGVAYAQKTDSTYTLKPLTFQERNYIINTIASGANIMNARTATEDDYKAGVKALNELIRSLMANITATAPKEPVKPLNEPKAEPKKP